jgi:hypothetical protein
MARKPDYRTVPKLEELGQKTNIPDLPAEYKRSLWRTVKVRIALKLPEETDHFINMLCLHFGLGRNEMCVHAINHLWGEVVQSIPRERVMLYEEKLEAVRLYRLQQRSEMEEARAVKLRQAMAKGGEKDRLIGYTWRYDNEKYVQTTRNKKR